MSARPCERVYDRALQACKGGARGRARAQLGACAGTQVSVAVCAWEARLDGSEAQLTDAAPVNDHALPRRRLARHVLNTTLRAQRGGAAPPGPQRNRATMRCDVRPSLGRCRAPSVRPKRSRGVRSARTPPEYHAGARARLDALLESRLRVGRVGHDAETPPPVRADDQPDL
jgi:hypothetical protein